jgi:hypothetical protein
MCSQSRHGSFFAHVTEMPRRTTGAAPNFRIAGNPRRRLRRFARPPILAWPERAADHRLADIISRDDRAFSPRPSWSPTFGRNRAADRDPTAAPQGVVAPPWIWCRSRRAALGLNDGRAESVCHRCSSEHLLRKPRYYGCLNNYARVRKQPVKAGRRNKLKSSKGGHVGRVNPRPYEPAKMLRGMTGSLPGHLASALPPASVIQNRMMSEPLTFSRPSRAYL